MRRSVLPDRVRPAFNNTRHSPPLDRTFDPLRLNHVAFVLSFISDSPYPACFSLCLLARATHYDNFIYNYDFMIIHAIL